MIPLLFRGPSGLPNLDGKLGNTTNLTDAFVDVCMDSLSVGKTQVIMDNLNPEWNESYSVDVCHYVEEVIFTVYDQDNVTNDKCGRVTFKAKELEDGIKMEALDGYPLSTRMHSERGRLFLSIQFISHSELQKASYDFEGYFPIRKNCRVTLYQDAHVPATLPQFKSMDPEHQPACCWKDIYHTIINSKQLICITGWSVWTDLKLLRGKDSSADDKTLGELLIQKAEEGIKVYVMVWDEATTGGTTGVLVGDLMGTHDEDTNAFFKNTGIS